jgi:hypothetical protein
MSSEHFRTACESAFLPARQIRHSPPRWLAHLLFLRLVSLLHATIYPPSLRKVIPTGPLQFYPQQIKQVCLNLYVYFEREDFFLFAESVGRLSAMMRQASSGFPLLLKLASDVRNCH